MKLAEWSIAPGSPAAALMWQAEGGSVQIVPSAALTPPADFGQPGEQGLKGEYFNNLTFDQSGLKSTRLDPSLEFIWSWGPVVSSPA